MLSEIAADIILLIHAAWVLFMIGGIIFTFAAYFRRSLFEWAMFRTAHLIGLLFTASLGIFGWNCPLTNIENSLRADGRGAVYPGSFLAHYLERIVYWEITQQTITIATIVLAVFVIATFVIRPPARIRKLVSSG